MSAQKKLLENGNTELTITLPWKEVENAYNGVIDDTVKVAELPGFRKGKAPREAVVASLNKEKTYEEVLKRLIPDAYQKSITETGIKPIIAPSITLTKAKEGEDWVITATTCEKPSYTLGDYKKAIQELKNAKRTKIWVPGQGENADGKKEEEKDKKPTLDELLNTLIGTVTIALPQILIDQEVNHMLSNIINETKKLGLTVDQYLASTGKTAESLRHEYEDEAKRMLTIELVLGDIADAEHIEVTDTDIEEVLKTAKSPEEKEGLEKEKYYLASILRRQKTIQHLASL